MTFLPVIRAAAVQGAYDNTPDPKTHRLCTEAAHPDSAADIKNIHCALELGWFSDIPPDPAKDTIIVAAYNLERGLKLDNQIRLFKKHPVLKRADVLLISESDRGCPRTNYRNVSRELAAAIGMNYVYGVEFIELPGNAASDKNTRKAPCEHGNSIMSRYPLSNVREIRHRKSASWYIPPEKRGKGSQPRLGGRMAIAADIVIAGRPVRFYAVHFESGFNDDDIRADEAAELIEDAAGFDGPVIIGGDMNTDMYVLDLHNSGGKDPTVREFLAAGYEDTHAGLSLKKRGTTRNEYGVRAVIDLFFVRGVSVLSSGICPGKHCDSLSDHLPIYTELKLKK